VEFQPFYTGQALFGDIDQYLRTRGFLLVDLRTNFFRGQDFREDLYSRHQPVWAHCLYLRSRELLEEGETEELALARYVALCVAYQHHDLALAMVTNGRSAAMLESLYGRVSRANWGTSSSYARGSVSVDCQRRRSSCSWAHRVSTRHAKPRLATARVDRPADTLP
jgi:hypothetical protein